MRLQGKLAIRPLVCTAEREMFFNHTSAQRNGRDRMKVLGICRPVSIGRSWKTLVQGGLTDGEVDTYTGAHTDTCMLGFANLLEISKELRRSARPTSWKA